MGSQKIQCCHLVHARVCLCPILHLSFKIDIMCGPWSTGHVFSQEMVRLSNLDRARDIGMVWHGMVQSGTSCHDVALTSSVNKSTINRLMTRHIDRECQKIVPRVVVQKTDNIISVMAAIPFLQQMGPKRGVPT